MSVQIRTHHKNTSHWINDATARWSCLENKAEASAHPRSCLPFSQRTSFSDWVQGSQPCKTRVDWLTGAGTSRHHAILVALLHVGHTGEFDVAGTGNPLALAVKNSSAHPRQGWKQTWRKPGEFGIVVFGLLLLPAHWVHHIYNKKILSSLKLVFFSLKGPM